MKETKLEILPIFIFETYSQSISDAELRVYEQLKESGLTIDSFSFYTSVSAVFSSKIEGESIEFDSYIKHKRFNIEFLPDYTQKIDDLYNAYQFAKTAQLNKENIDFAHKLLTTHILPTKQQGKFRTSNMYVTTDDGRIEYVAAPPFIVNAEIEKFYSDLKTLLESNLTLKEIFFFASLLHLVFVKIHPFNDGNGRISRLIEKWFLAQKLGENAWFIQSEKNYYLEHQTYYKNIRQLGFEYEALNYEKSIPFLLMLPNSLVLSNQ